MASFQIQKCSFIVNDLLITGCSTHFRSWSLYNPVWPYKPVDIPPGKKHKTVHLSKHFNVHVFYLCIYVSHDCIKHVCFNSGYMFQVYILRYIYISK